MRLEPRVSPSAWPPVFSSQGRLASFYHCERRKKSLLRQHTNAAFKLTKIISEVRSLYSESLHFFMRCSWIVNVKRVDLSLVIVTFNQESVHSKSQNHLGFCVLFPQVIPVAFGAQCNGIRLRIWRWPHQIEDVVPQKEDLSPVHDKMF